MGWQIGGGGAGVGFTASASASATVGAGGGGSFSASRTNIESEFASVGEQSGIRAGDGGFDVKVKGKTVLKGGAITSTQVAVDEQRNGFESKGGVELQDVHNETRYKARSSSTTRAGISSIAGHKDARTGDAETGLALIFDREKVSNEIQAQVVINEGSSGRCSRTCMAEL